VPSMNSWCSATAPAAPAVGRSIVVAMFVLPLLSCPALHPQLLTAGV
jgi:hypothetical protein